MLHHQRLGSQVFCLELLPSPIPCSQPFLLHQTCGRKHQHECTWQRGNGVVTDKLIYNRVGRVIVDLLDTVKIKE